MVRWAHLTFGTVEAQAQHDVIPREAANRIKAGCNVDKLDMERLRTETDIVGYPILPLIKQLEGMCEGGSGRYLVSSHLRGQEVCRCADVMKSTGEQLHKT